MYISTQLCHKHKGGKKYSIKNAVREEKNIKNISHHATHTKNWNLKRTQNYVNIQFSHEREKKYLQ